MGLDAGVLSSNLTSIEFLFAFFFLAQIFILSFISPHSLLEDFSHS